MEKPRPQPTLSRELSKSIEKDVVILLSDMVGYSQKATNMLPVAIQAYMVSYHHKLKDIVQKVNGTDQQIKPSAGDGALAVFEKQQGETIVEVCNRATRTALEMIYAMEDGTLPRTRVGLFYGTILETIIDGTTMRFGSAFSVASRLEQLCDYFGTYLLMGKRVAYFQNEYNDRLTSISKITPKNITHPIHIYSIYEPGIHNISSDAEPQKLRNFLNVKNRAVELFCGNQLKDMLPDFPAAERELLAAKELFAKISNKADVATERLLQYIRKNPCPEQEFTQVGMKIWDTETQTTEVAMPSLPGELFKAVDCELYTTLFENTEWENKFKLIWRDKGDTIIKINTPPDGVYFIARGEVSVFNDADIPIAQLKAGNIFGEMAYFYGPTRTATIIADTDLVLRRITCEDLDQLPVIKKILGKIADQRRIS